jgi:hypothetical protein
MSRFGKQVIEGRLNRMAARIWREQGQTDAPPKIQYTMPLGLVVMASMQMGELAYVHGCTPFIPQEDGTFKMVGIYMNPEDSYEVAMLTIIHEIAHALVGPGSSHHDEQWFDTFWGLETRYH